MNLEPASEIARLTTLVGHLEGEVRLQRRDAETQNRMAREAIAARNAYRVEAEIWREVAEEKQDDKLVWFLVRARSALADLRIAIDAHRDRYVKQNRTDMHPWDERLYEVLERTKDE